MATPFVGFVWFALVGPGSHLAVHALISMQPPVVELGYRSKPSSHHHQDKFQSFKNATLKVGDAWKNTLQQNSNPAQLEEAVAEEVLNLATQGTLHPWQDGWANRVHLHTESGEIGCGNLNAGSGGCDIPALGNLASDCSGCCRAGQKLQAGHSCRIECATDEYTSNVKQLHCYDQSIVQYYRNEFCQHGNLYLMLLDSRDESRLSTPPTSDYIGSLVQQFGIPATWNEDWDIPRKTGCAFDGCSPPEFQVATGDVSNLQCSRLCDFSAIRQPNGEVVHHATSCAVGDGIPFNQFTMEGGTLGEGESCPTQCEEGYSPGPMVPTLEDNTRGLMCGPNGWEPPAWECVRNPCTLPQVSHAKTEGTQDAECPMGQGTLPTGSTCTPACDRGYWPRTQVDGEPPQSNGEFRELECSDDGVLSPERFQCVQMCSMLEADIPVHAAMLTGSCKHQASHYGGFLPQGSSCNPDCEEGYGNDGEAITCQSDGLSHEFQCTRITTTTTTTTTRSPCHLPQVEHSTVTSCGDGRVLQSGEACQVSCDSSFNIVVEGAAPEGDDLEISCDDGTLSPNTFECQQSCTLPGGRQGVLYGSMDDPQDHGSQLPSGQGLPIFCQTGNPTTAWISCLNGNIVPPNFACNEEGNILPPSAGNEGQGDHPW